MTRYEYKVVPAPVQGRKAKGVKGTAARFANALETLMNEMGAEGWEYVRADTLPCEERTGLTGRSTTFQNLLVFRRADAADEGRPEVAGLLTAPLPEAELPGVAPGPIPQGPTPHGPTPHGPDPQGMAPQGAAAAPPAGAHRRGPDSHGPDRHGPAAHGPDASGAGHRWPEPPAAHGVAGGEPEPPLTRFAARETGPRQTSEAARAAAAALRTYRATGTPPDEDGRGGRSGGGLAAE